MLGVAIWPFSLCILPVRDRPATINPTGELQLMILNRNKAKNPERIFDNAIPTVLRRAGNWLECLETYPSLIEHRLALRHRKGDLGQRS